MSPFETAMVAEIPALRRYARTLTRTQRNDTEDLVQDTVARALTKQHLFKEDSNMRSWLFTIMHNMNVNRVRMSVKRVTTDDIPEIPVPATQEKVIELKECARELSRLPPHMRQVVTLIGVENLNYTDTAEILSIPIGTVRSRLSRGRDELRKKTDAPYEPRHHNYPAGRRYALA